MKYKVLLIVFITFLGFSFGSFGGSSFVRAQETDITQPADGLRIEQVQPEQAFQPMQCMCYPWVWSWETWWHHHVWWNGCGWVHTYARADYVYHSFFNRYVWICTWPGCGAIRF